ncbi:type VII secretion protein EccE [Streptomyces sp. URMC 126]|uniref:type VII secretion protein EccE n=1 Tax=Streptomyces sp. URMC 126 TaxID=3423401 RepID=UPI003F196D36
MASAARSAQATVVRRRSGPGRLGPVRLQQLVLLEVAAALVLVGYAVDPLLAAPAGGVAVVLAALALARRRQRPVPEWLGAVLALRRRTRGAAGAAVTEVAPALAPLVECEPALRVESFTDREGRSIGVVGDGTFVTVVLRIETVDEPLRPHRVEKALPLGLLRDALDTADVRLESVQVVQSTLPSPAPHLPAESLAARNYAPLQALTGAPAVRMTWVALKLDPELCPEAVAARGGGVRGARRCALRAADQLTSRLRSAGFRSVLLSEDDLESALSTAANVNPAATAQASRSGTGARRTAETSRTWRCDDRWHTSYWVGRWPQLGAGAASLPQLAALLTSLPALSTTLSLTLGRGGARGGGLVPTVTGHIRVCGRSADELGDVRRELERTARGVKVGLVRLDHEQVPGVLATLPLGGTR